MAGLQRTIASAYSIRPKPHAPVSAPLDWDELPDVHPTDFTVLTMPERFRAVGDKHAGLSDHAFGIEPLLELAERYRGLDLGVLATAAEQRRQEDREDRGERHEEPRRLDDFVVLHALGRWRGQARASCVLDN